MRPAVVELQGFCDALNEMHRDIHGGDFTGPFTVWFHENMEGIEGPQIGVYSDTDDDAVASLSWIRRNVQVQALELVMTTTTDRVFEAQCRERVEKLRAEMQAEKEQYDE